MFRNQTAAMLSGFCLTLAACDNPTRELTAPEPERASVDTRSGSLLAPSNTWTHTRRMPRARFDHEAGVVNDVIYVVGGRTFFRKFNKVDAYNVATNTWSTVQSLPNIRINLNGVSTIGGKLYVAGGLNANNVGVKTLFVYNPATNTWTRKADMPAGGCCGSQGVIGGELYVYVSSESSGPGRLYRYTPGTDRWATLASPSGEHVFPEGAAVAGKFYLVGNRGGPGSGDQLEVYNPATNSWTTKAPMPQPSGQVMASAVLNGKFYVAGGVERGTGDAQATLRVYDPVTNTWTTRAPMPNPRSWAAGAAAAGRVFVLGGLNASETVLATVIAYTP
jgi:N-acetylneuraminic acid mutarotase